MAALSPAERAVIVPRYLEDLPIAQVATTLGVAEGTVKSTTHRALARLRASLHPLTTEVSR